MNITVQVCNFRGENLTVIYLFDVPNFRPLSKGNFFVCYVRHFWEVIRPKLFVCLSPDPAINNELANDIIN